MKKLQYVCKIFVFSLMLISTNIFAAWEPTFVDNFNGAILDSGSWLTGRENLQSRLNYYHKDAVAVRDGKLHLKLLERAQSDRSYTTGAVTTQGLFAQKYGYFEIRAKFPAGAGFWPAFWLIPTSGKWSSEIDIVEFIGNKPDSIHYAFHYDHKLQNQHSKLASIGSNLTQGFNNYGLKWSPNKLEYFFNGRLMHTINGAQKLSKADSPMYIILNLALASQHIGWIKKVDSSTNINQEYAIDYVRVFKEIPNGTYAQIPGYTTQIADKRSDAKYDNTPISIEPMESQPDVMRSPGKISGSVKLTAHAAVSATVNLALFKVNSIDNRTGNFIKSSPLQQITRTVNFRNRNESLRLAYKFDRHINSPGVYIIDIVIKDTASQNKNNLNGYRLVQYVDNAHPETTKVMDGFVKNGSASYFNAKINSSFDLMLQQSILAPYLNIRYSIIDAQTGATVARKDFKHYHNGPGKITLNGLIDASLQSSRSYKLTIDVSDSSGRIKLSPFTVAIQKQTQAAPRFVTAQAIPKKSTDPVISAAVVSKTSSTVSTYLIVNQNKLPVRPLNYIIKLYSKSSGALVRKFSGTYRKPQSGAQTTNGKQLVKINSDDAQHLPSGDYRLLVMLYKNNTWSDLLARQFFEVSIDNQAQGATNVDIHSLSVNKSVVTLGMNLSMTLSKASSIRTLNFIAKFYSLNNKLVSKVTGTKNVQLRDGRQIIGLNTDHKGAIKNRDYKVVVTLYKNTWNENDKIATGKFDVQVR
ncbi:MAG: glycoside hydrolase family 16 protein [Gammaproteobacteria bacterium]